MTQEEKKAEELIDKFIAAGCLFANAINCAIIAVDEILELLKSEGIVYGAYFWQSVKSILTNKQQ